MEVRNKERRGVDEGVLRMDADTGAIDAGVGGCDVIQSQGRTFIQNRFPDPSVKWSAFSAPPFRSVMLALNTRKLKFALKNSIWPNAVNAQFPNTISRSPLATPDVSLFSPRASAVAEPSGISSALPATIAPPGQLIGSSTVSCAGSRNSSIDCAIGPITAT